MKRTSAASLRPAADSRHRGVRRRRIPGGAGDRCDPGGVACLPSGRTLVGVECAVLLAIESTCPLEPANEASAKARLAPCRIRMIMPPAPAGERCTCLAVLCWRARRASPRHPVLDRSSAADVHLVFGPVVEVAGAGPLQRSAHEVMTAHVGAALTVGICNSLALIP